METVTQMPDAETAKPQQLNHKGGALALPGAYVRGVSVDDDAGGGDGPF